MALQEGLYPSPIGFILTAWTKAGPIRNIVALRAAYIKSGSRPTLFKVIVLEVIEYKAAKKVDKFIRTKANIG